MKFPPLFIFNYIYSSELIDNHEEKHVLLGNTDYELVIRNTYVFEV